MPGAEPNTALLLDLPFRADPGDSDPFRKVVVASWLHFCGLAGGCLSAAEISKAAKLHRSRVDQILTGTR